MFCAFFSGTESKAHAECICLKKKKLKKQSCWFFPPYIKKVSFGILDESSVIAEWQDNGLMLVKRETEMMCCKVITEDCLTGMRKWH